MAIRLVAKRDQKNLRLLRDRLLDWLAEAVPAEEDDRDETASVETEIDTADEFTVGSKG